MKDVFAILALALVVAAVVHIAVIAWLILSGAGTLELFSWGVSCLMLGCAMVFCARVARAFETAKGMPELIPDYDEAPEVTEEMLKRSVTGKEFFESRGMEVPGKRK